MSSFSKQSTERKVVDSPLDKSENMQIVSLSDTPPNVKIKIFCETTFLKGVTRVLFFGVKTWSEEKLGELYQGRQEKFTFRFVCEQISGFQDV